MKDAVATMGMTLPNDAGGRDAVHVAVFSAVSNERLFPGQHIAIEHHAERDTVVKPTLVPSEVDKLIAIVDPFIGSSILPGQRFWAYLYPRTITALSHQWSHPAFDETAASASYASPSSKLSSEEWLRAFCKTHDCPSYEKTIAYIRLAVDGGGEWGQGYDHCRIEDEYLQFGGIDAHGDIPPEFWDHVENVIGKKVPKRPIYFTCAC